MNTVVIGAAIVVLGWASLPTPAEARCFPEGEIGPCTTVDGCPGSRTCLGGYPTKCIKDDPLSCPAPPGTNDVFIGTNAPANAVGILVDGRRGSAEVDDEIYVITPSGAQISQVLGTLRGSSLANEVLSFAATRAPTRHATPWTVGQDTFTELMTNTVRVPITIWILTAPGTFSAQSQQALSAVIQAGALFDQERLGLDFNLIEVRDETNNPNRGNFLNVTALIQLETQIGHVSGRINVYWVQAVDGGSGNGRGEDTNGDSVAVGFNAAPGLLAHEIGHNLALEHVDGDARFDGTNVMNSNRGTRQFLTEGQGYRAHIRSTSAIRSTQVYNLRPGMPTIDTCTISSTTRTCPKADKRIWADGPTWPAN
jgi:hypothetical protein